MTKIQTLTWAALTAVGGIAGILIGESIAKSIH